MGPVVDWLGVELNASEHTFRMKPTFVEKFTNLASRMLKEGEEDHSIREWFSLGSSIIYVVWTRQIDLCNISDIIRWMAELGSKVRKAEDWNVRVTVPQNIRKRVQDETQLIAKNARLHLPISCRDVPTRAVGMSDASRHALAWSSHTSTCMSLEVVVNEEPDKPIFYAELEAAIRGSTKAANETERNSGVFWLCDNTGAVYVARKGLSRMESVNETLRGFYETKKKRRIKYSIDYVPTLENVVDKASRSLDAVKFSGPPCANHPGKWCSHFIRWIENVTGKLRLAPKETHVTVKKEEE